MELLSIEDQEDKITRVTTEIEKLEKLNSSYRFDIKELANKYKERGDRYINLYLSKYALFDETEVICADKSIEDYKKAIEVFNGSHYDLESIYATMALGNAYKEKFLPGMPKETFYELYRSSQKQYEKCVEFYFNNMEKHAQEYFFVMLEQINLLVRKKVWDNDSKPKRIVILHSLGSPESHICLEWIHYLAYKYKCELWEYRFGKVRIFDPPKKFIQDRLSETCAVIILASEYYDYNKTIIKCEVDKVKRMIKEEDPFKVFIVDLGNKDLIDKFPENKYCKKINKDTIEEEIFINFYRLIPHLYECIKVRLSSR